MSTTAAPITYGTSDVRLACAIRKMGDAYTLQALAAIKDDAKDKLLPRDLPKLRATYDSRKQYLRSIPADPATPTF